MPSYEVSRNRLKQSSDDSSIRLLPTQYGPHDPRVLVCDSNDRSVEAASLAKAVDPGALGIRLARRGAYHSTGTVNDESAKVLVPTLTDPEELGAVSAGVLPGY